MVVQLLLEARICERKRRWLKRAAFHEADICVESFMTLLLCKRMAVSGYLLLETFTKLTREDENTLKS